MNALDVTARGLAAQALASQAALGSSIGAATVGTGTQENTQAVLDRLAGVTLAETELLDLDATGRVQQVLTSDRGVYEKSPGEPPAAEFTHGFAFTDAGGTIWAKPKDRVCKVREYGIFGETEMDDWGQAIGTGIDQSAQLQAIFWRIAQWGGVADFEGVDGLVRLKSSVVKPVGVAIKGWSGMLPQRGADNPDPPHPWNTVPPGAGSMRFMPTADAELFAADGTLRSVAKDGSCQEGFLFFNNIDPANDPTRCIKRFSSDALPSEDICFDGLPTNGVSFMATAAALILRRVRPIMAAKLLYAPINDATIGGYLDRMVIEDIDCLLRANDTDYLIDMGNCFGDGWRVARVSADYTGSQTGNSRAFYSMCSRGLTIEAMINGIVYLGSGVSGATLANWHGEGHQYIHDGGDVAMQDCHLQHGGNSLTPIVFKNSAQNWGETCRLSLRGVSFLHYANPSGGGTSGWSPTSIPDIDYQASRGVLTMDGNCRRVASLIGETYKAVAFAPLIGDGAGGLLPGWSQHAPMLAGQPTSIANRNILANGCIPGKTGNFRGIKVTAYQSVSATAVFEGADATYYYMVIPVFDRLHKLARTPVAGGGYTTEANLAVTNGGPLPRIEFDPTVLVGAHWLLVLRGTASGNYDREAWLPACDGQAYVLDNGKAVGSFAWVDRNGTEAASGPSGAAPAFNNNGWTTGDSIYANGCLTLRNVTSVLAGSNPTAGTWSEGEMITFPTSVPDVNNMKLVERVCRIGGTYGAGAPVFDPHYVSKVSPAS